MSVKWGNTASDYAEFRLGFPSSLYERLQEYLGGIAGKRILDIGTGTGTVARELSRMGAKVTGLDQDRGMIDKANELAPSIDWQVSSAESLDFADGTFDAIIAGQCWHWFDRTAVAAESWRLLKQGGRLVIMHYDWIPVDGNVVELTESLIKQYSPKWEGYGGVGVYPWHLDLDKAGYDSIQSFTYDEPGRYTHLAWRGRIRASAGVGGLLQDEEVRSFDQDLANLLQTIGAEDPMDVPHRVFGIVGSKNGGARPNKAVNWTP